VCVLVCICVCVYKCVHIGVCVLAMDHVSRAYDIGGVSRSHVKLRIHVSREESCEGTLQLRATLQLIKGDSAIN